MSYTTATLRRRLLTACV